MPSYSRTVKVPGKSSNELYSKVAQGIEHFLSKTAVGDVDILRDETKKQVSVKSKLFSATLFCEEGQLRLDGQLSLFASPFKSKIDEGIDRWIAKTFQTG